jgi:winged helix-turn helix protein
VICLEFAASLPVFEIVPNAAFGSLRGEPPGPSHSEAAEILGMSERSYRRLRGRYDGKGAAGLLDRRLGKVSPHRIAADKVARIVSLYPGRHASWTMKHSSSNRSSPPTTPRVWSDRRCSARRTARSARAGRRPRRLQACLVAGRERGHRLELARAARGDRPARSVLNPLHRPCQPPLLHAQSRRQGR